MSCQLSVLANFDEIRLVKKYLFREVPEDVKPGLLSLDDGHLGSSAQVPVFTSQFTSLLFTPILSLATLWTMLASYTTQAMTKQLLFD